MKSSKLFGMTAVICLFVVACAESDRQETARIAKAGAQKTTAEQANEIKDLGLSVKLNGYKSDGLVLQKNESDARIRNLGMINLTNDIDAKELYERLLIKAENIDSTDAKYTMIAKKASSLTCTQSTLVESQDKVGYSCSLYIDYETGAVKQSSQEVTVDANARAKETSYSGKQLTITTKTTSEKTDSSAVLMIDGDDAKALYAALGLEEKEALSDSWLRTKEKRGANIICQQMTTDMNVVYLCKANLDPATGEVQSAQ